MQISVLQEMAHKNSSKKGFWDNEFTILNKMLDSENFNPEEISFFENLIITQKLMLMVSELSEAMEACRTNGRQKSLLKLQDYIVNTRKNNKAFDEETFKELVKDSFADELADTIIRIADFAGYMGIDLQWHVEQKMMYNANRPYKHGKKY